MISVSETQIRGESTLSLKIPQKNFKVRQFLKTAFFRMKGYVPTIYHAQILLKNSFGRINYLCRLIAKH